jgi:hypothetical protein
LIYRRTRESDADTSQVLEFSKEVGEEIIKVALKLILEEALILDYNLMAVNQVLVTYQQA